MDDLQRFARQAVAVSSADQDKAALVNVAADTAAYRKRLLADKVPRQLADELTLMVASFLLDTRLAGCGCEAE